MASWFEMRLSRGLEQEYSESAFISFFESKIPYINGFWEKYVFRNQGIGDSDIRNGLVITYEDMTSSYEATLDLAMDLFSLESERVTTDIEIKPEKPIEHYDFLGSSGVLKDLSSKLDVRIFEFLSREG